MLIDGTLLIPYCGFGLTRTHYTEGMTIRENLLLNKEVIDSLVDLEKVIVLLLDEEGFPKQITLDHLITKAEIGFDTDIDLIIVESGRPKFDPIHCEWFT